MTNRVSTKVSQFTESVIREMTRQANMHGAVNLSQGFPDWSAPESIKQAACDAINSDINQYAITWGAKRFRDAIATKTKRYLGIDADPDSEIVVTCGSTEAMIAAMMATVNPGDEVIVFEPYYENYWPDSILSGAVIKFVTLRPPHWNFDPDELRAAFSDKTKAIIITTPHNPTGKVFSYEELRFIADLCIEHNTIALTDEIYEHIWYPDADKPDMKHTAMVTMDGMRDKTVTINSLSKTYSVTGWRVGYAIAAPDLTNGIRQVHDFLTVGAAAPLQEAGVFAMSLPDSYYQSLQSDYLKRRNFLVDVLQDVGFRCSIPDGAYYIMADISNFGFDNDVLFTKHLIQNIGVAVVPGSSFFSNPNLGKHIIRFCFCKKDETLQAAADKLLKLKKL